jgi:endonuclease/exonuclease/phosphatase (EEP) superfamily protein YafD
MVRLRLLLSRLHVPHVVVGGDWNRVWPLRAPLAGFGTREPPAATGSRGGRIDFLWWKGAGERTIRVIGHTYSDHNGVRVGLRLH